MDTRMDLKAAALIIGAIVIIGAALYFSTKGPQSAPNGMTTSSTAESTTTAKAKTSASTAASKPKTTTSSNTAKILTAGVGSLSNLVALKQSVSCSFVTTSGTKRSGIGYFSGGNMRANLSNGVSMIQDSQYLYAWVNGATTGLKLLAASSASGSAIASRGGLDPLTELSYTCYAWTPDTSLFAPPANITFTDTSGN